MDTFSGSAWDGGQMANVQCTVGRPPGPTPTTANWLEPLQQPKHHQQHQQLKEDGEPVAVRVMMTNGSGTPSERSDNYIVPPFGTGPNQPESPSHLAYLYERAQQPVVKPYAPLSGGMHEMSGGGFSNNGFVPGTTSSPWHGPTPDSEYRSLSRAVPAPAVHQQQRSQASTATEATSSSEYNALSRATPAPILQHTASTSSGEATTPTSPRGTLHVKTDHTPTAQVQSSSSSSSSLRGFTLKARTEQYN